MDDIQKAFDESLNQTIAARSQFDSAKAALEAKIRAKIETKLEAMPLKKRAIGNVGETAAGLTDRYVDECIWEAKRKASVKRAKIERSQDQARIVHQKLIAALFGKSVTQWGDSEKAMYEQIVAWLENK